MDTLNIEQELNLKDHINVLRRRRGVVILFFITVVSVVTIGSLIMKPVYRATATLLIDTESPNVLTTSGVVALESQHYFSYKEYYQSQKEIITSLSIVSKVFDEFDLAKSKEYARAKEPLKKFLKTIKVEPVRDTRLLKLNVDNKNPELAAKIANRIAGIYVKRNLYYISRDELMNLLKNEYLKLEAKLSEYSKIYKGNHPKMARLKKEMAEMSKRIEKAKKTTFDADFFGEEGTQAGYKYALEGFKANNVSIQDPAEVPVVPIRPKKRLNVFLAVIVGLFGGTGLAFFFEYLNDTVKGIEDLKCVAEWPFLGSVPKIGNNGKMTEFEKDLLAHIKPKDSASEAYRTIRTSIFFSSIEEHPLESIAITSPGPREGKTTTVCNLAIAMAQSEKRVLLVDADMRKPRLHEIFKKNNERGLSTFLSSQAEFDNIIQKTDIENIFLVTGGPHPPNPSELLSSHKMKEFVAAAKQEFDLILFDTPPVAVVTDAVVISRFIDGIVMVIESEKTSRRVLPRIFQTLENARAKVIGTILNKISVTSGDYAYHYYARYYGKDKVIK
ncbi:MAG: polysaccharide biosynthesis tyrosine autokinase [Candidatus Omnitrophota bacterium]|nr:polysaccharide biosynthesis tyrosine autokinase [Candidatus Omnitrophota bacterium]